MPSDGQTSSQSVRSEKPAPVGPTVGIVIIVLLLVVAALYFWAEQARQTDIPPSYIPGDQT